MAVSAEGEKMLTQVEIDHIKELAYRHIETGKSLVVYGLNKAKKTEAMKLFRQFVKEERENLKTKEEK